MIGNNALLVDDPNLAPSPMVKLEDMQQPFVCFNRSAVAPDPKKIYGYFSRDVTVRSKYSIRKRIEKNNLN